MYHRLTLILNAMRQVEKQAITRIKGSPVVPYSVQVRKATTKRHMLVLGTCPDVADAIDMLEQLEQGPLTLETERAARVVRVAVDELARVVARVKLEERFFQQD